MANSTNKKPQKPRADFPLFPHNNGQWAKKIRGRLRYFGLWADPAAALALYLEQKDYLFAGLEPPATQDALTVHDLCVRFLEAKKQQQADGGLSGRSYKDYFDTCERVSKSLGSLVAVESLIPENFAELRKSISKNRSPGSLRNEMQRVRVVLPYQSAPSI